MIHELDRQTAEQSEIQLPDMLADPALIPTMHHLNQGLFDERKRSAVHRQMEPYLDAHGKYIANLVDRAGERAADKQSGVTIKPLEAGQSVHFATSDGQPQAPLDLASLGLPQLGKKDNITPLAIMVHEKRASDAVSSVELVGVKADGTPATLVLEVAPSTNGNVPQWIGKGAAEFSVFAKEADVTVAQGRGKKGMVAVAAKPSDKASAIEFQTRVIRPVPTKVEKQADAGGETWRNKVLVSRAKKIGAVVAATVVTILPFAHIQSAPRHDLRSATEVVLPYGTDSKYGIKQAEQYFSADTLDRSREAFAAYYAGDTNALQAQIEADNYHPNWITPEAFSAVESASNFDELQTAFKQAIGSLPVDFKVPRNNKDLEDLSTYYDHTLETDLGDTKHEAIAVLKYYNLFDEAGLKKRMVPLTYAVVNSAKGKPGSPDGVLNEAGGYCQTGGDKPDVIVLAAGHSKLGDLFFKDSAEGLTAHESEHYGATIDTHGIEGIIGGLNPDNFMYAGLDNASFYDIYFKGQRVVTDGYGRSNDQEDTADIAMKLFVQKADIELTDSPYFEKLSALIFATEDSQPGFTASFLLSHANMHKPTLAANVQHYGWEALDKLHDLGSGVDALPLLLTMYVLASRRLRAKALRNQGLGGAAVTNIPQLFRPQS